MKAIKILTMAALATAVFASCSSEDELAQNNYPMDNVVRIMTSVDGMNTRASYGNKGRQQLDSCYPDVVAEFNCRC
jgi:hypothetical protein